MKLSSLIYFLLCFGCSSSLIFAQDDLHQKVFGKNTKPQFISFDVISNGQSYGQMKLQVVGEKIITIEKASFISIFERLLTPQALSELSNLNQITIEDLTRQNIYLKIDWVEFQIVPTIPIGMQVSQVTIVRSTRPDWANKEKSPAAQSMIFNYQLQRDDGDKAALNKKNSAIFDMAYNFNNWVLESKWDYASNRQYEWKRGNIRVVRDNPDKMIRYQMGEVDYTISGYQSFRPMLGASVTRNFSLNPYRIVTPLNQRDFYLEERSFVTVLVNNRIVKSDYFNAGKHSLTDLPLVSGLNDVQIRVVDSRGREKIIQYRQTTSTDLLTKGLDKFSLAVGLPYVDSPAGHHLTPSDHQAVNIDYLRGWSSYFTAGAWGQMDANQKVVGSRGIWATPIGNYSFDLATSTDARTGKNGNVAKMSYAFLHNGFGLNESVRTTMALEKMSPYFSQWGQIAGFNSFDYRTRINNSVIISDHFLLNIGGSYLTTRDSSQRNRYSYELGSNHRLFSTTQLNIVATKTRMESGAWDNSIGFFLNINFPDSNQYLNMNWDSTSQLARSQWRKQSPQNINVFNGGVAASRGKDKEIYEADGEYRTTFADVRGYVRDDNGANSGFVQLNGAVLMANNHWAISRPVAGSFAMIVPNENLVGQRLALSSYSQYKEGQNLGEKRLIINNLVPYHFQRFLIDTTLLDPGVALEEEMFVLSPGYRTGHLLKLGSSGKVVLMANLVNESKNPYSLVTGNLKSSDGTQVPFFTSKNGMFVVENVKPGDYELVLDGQDKVIKLTIPSGIKGIYKAGTYAY